jgi:hypothetical protein
MYADATGIAYLLHPKYFSEHIDIADIPKIIKYISEWGSQTAIYSDVKKEILKCVANSRASPDEDDTRPRS